MQIPDSILDFTGRRMETELTCAVCSDVYLEGKREPVTLPECGHTFCRQCLLNVEKAGSISCPYCRTKHHGPPVAQISTVYALLNLTKFLRRSKYGICDGHSATLDFWCQTCGKGLCGYCLYEGHAKDNHHIVVMKNAMEEKKEELKSVGQRHLEHISNGKTRLLNEIHDCLTQVSNLCDNAKALTTSVNEIKLLMYDASNSFNIELIADVLEKIQEYRTLISKDVEEDMHAAGSVPASQDRYSQELEDDTTSNKDTVTTRASRGSDTSVDKPMPESSSNYDSDDGRSTHFEVGASALMERPCADAGCHEALETKHHNLCRRASTEDRPEYLTGSSVSSATAQRIELVDYMTSEENLTDFNSVHQTARLDRRQVYTSGSHGNDITDSEDGSETAGIDGWLKWSARASDGREGRLRWEDGRLHLYSLTNEPQNVHANIKFPVLLSLLQTSPEVFLDIGADGVRFGRVYIKIWGELRRAQHFLALCVGSLGPSYKGSRCSKVEGKDKPGECLRVNHYVTADGILTARGLMDGLEWSGEYSAVKKEGLVVAASGGKSEYDGCFDICTRSNPAKKFSCPFGEVVSGLSVVKTATSHDPIGDLTIMNTGVVLINKIS